MLKSFFPEMAGRIGIRLGMAFSRLPVSPNSWTVISLVPAILGFVSLVFYKEMFAGFVLFALSAAMDAIDGGVARVTGRVTNFGAYLDGMADRIVEALLIFGLIFFGVNDWLIPGYAWAALLLFAGTCMTSFAKAYADHREAMDENEIEKMPGLLERAERVLLVFLGMLLWHANAVYLTYALALASVLACITVVQRVYFVRSAQ